MNALVTGGGGFLGRRIVELLLSEGHTVRFLARGRYPEVEAQGATGLPVDLRDASALNAAVRGVDAVFHVAGKAGVWGPRDEFFSTNVTGTENLLTACRAEGVRKFIYTSTPSVVGYAADANGIAEAPYATEHLTPYPETKAAAERLVLAANSPSLLTVALRPHLIYGPRDNNLLPRVVQNAFAGRMMQVGDGTNRVDITYVDNAAGAHLDAERALVDASSPCAGRAYFISNGEPVNLWAWMADFLAQVGAPPVKRKISAERAMRFGGMMEWVWSTFGLKGEPRMTRFLAAALSKSHWYDMGPAERDFGYTVRVSRAEGEAATVAWFRETMRAGG